MLFAYAIRRTPRAGARTLATTTFSAHNEAMPPPLRGLKILDLSRVLAAPMATMLLADLGYAS